MLGKEVDLSKLTSSPSSSCHDDGTSSRGTTSIVCREHDSGLTKPAVPDTTKVVRKSRITFEMDPFNLLFEQLLDDIEGEVEDSDDC